MSENFALELQLTANSPVIISKNLPIGNKYTSIQSIPVSTLKGAISTALRKALCSSPNINDCSKCDKNCIFKNKIIDKFNVKPGVPIIDKKNDKLINHQNHEIFNETPKTIERCKKCGELKDFTSDYLEIKKIDRRCTNKISETICKNETFSKVSGPYCATCNKNIEVEKVLKTNIAIDRNLFSTIEGMLFYYEAVQQKTKFSSLLIGTGNELKEELMKLKRIYVGRGVSRGYGAVDITLKDIDLNKLISERVERIEDCINKSNELIFIAETPIASLIWKNKCLHSIPKIDQIKVNGTNLKLEKAIGSTTYVSGWALHTNTQKPRIYAASPGSVFVYSINNTDQSFLKKLAIKELIGIGEDFLIKNGFNQMAVWRVLNG